MGRRVALLILVVTLLLATLAAISVTKSITVPIQQAVKHAERIAAGDLTKEILSPTVPRLANCSRPCKI